MKRAIIAIAIVAALSCGASFIQVHRAAETAVTSATFSNVGGAQTVTGSDYVVVYQRDDVGNFKEAAFEVINTGAALTAFKMEVKGGDGGWHDYLATSGDWTSTTNSALALCTVDPTSLASNATGTYIDVYLGAATAFRLSAKCGDTTSVTVKGNLK